MPRKKDSVSFNITMSAVMASKIEALSDELGISRSAAVNVMVSQGFQARDGLNAMSELMEAYKAEKAEQKPDSGAGE